MVLWVVVVVLWVVVVVVVGSGEAEMIEFKLFGGFGD